MKITADEAAKMAALAQIKMNEREAAEYTGELNSIMAYIDRIKVLDTDDIQPTIYVLPLQNVWREDEMQPCLSNEQALANAAETEAGMYLVPRVIE